MRDLLPLLFFELVAVPAFSMGTKVPPGDYVDLGTMKIDDSSRSGKINLPYYKPEGVERVLTNNQIMICVIKLIVDGKVIKPKRGAGSYELADSIWTESVSRDEENREVEMYWSPVGGKSWDSVKDEPSRRIYHYHQPKRLDNPLQYLIKYPAKEVFLNYGINYPSRYRNVYYPLEGEYDEEMLELMDKTYYVKWTIEWDIPRLSD